MKFLLQSVLFLLIWVGGLLFILLLGHVISLCFLNTWQLTNDAKNFCAVIGTIGGLFIAIVYFGRDMDMN